MSFTKFSIVGLILILSFNAFSFERFLPKECLDASYKTFIKHKGPLFGLLPHELEIQKKNCVITINHKKYLPVEWIIDVCREPVHIKKSSATGTDVAKKDGECINKDKTKNSSDFCSQLDEVMEVVQDDGLIFAEGDRDSLNTPHGKTYCSYLLLKRYLQDSMLFSRYTEVPEIFLDGQKVIVPSAVEIPAEAAAPGAAAAPVK